MNYVFGPVPSRRLGFSLGVDLLPFKTCTIDCVYCQVGRTTLKTLDRKDWAPRKDIIAEIRQAVQNKKNIDAITFSGSGEPTLHRSLGEIISKIRSFTQIPVCVLTNSTLMHLPEVRSALARADRVIPSLDAVSEAVFEKINRPCPGITAAGIVENLEKFRTEYSGELWLEVMLVKGINDTPDEMERIARAIPGIRPDKVQINSVFRPAADSDAVACEMEILKKACRLFGDRAEIIGGFSRDPAGRGLEDIGEEILKMVKRRPCSAVQISRVTGVPEAEIQSQLDKLKANGELHSVAHQNETFYKAGK